MSSLAVEDGLKIAVLLPCHNEAADRSGRWCAASPRRCRGATVYVFDNNSTDDTARAAARAGARVFREARQGKGNVVRRMFADIDADIYVMADGDGTYDPADAPSLVNALITERVDMVVGTRRGVGARRRPLRPRLRQSQLQPALPPALRRRLHRHLLGLPRLHPPLREELSGDLDRLRDRDRDERACEPADDPGRRDRPDLRPAAERLGDASCRTFRDGFRILKMFAMLMKETRPFVFYAIFAALFWVAGLRPDAPGHRDLAADRAGAAVPDRRRRDRMFVIGFMLGRLRAHPRRLSRSRVEQKRILFLTVPALGAQ